MYSKIKNDNEWWTCRHLSSSCQTSPSATWQLEWVSEKQKGEEGPCSPNKQWWLLIVVFTVFHLCHPSALSCLLVSCASLWSLPLCGILTMVVLHGGHHHVVLVVVVSWCWSVVVTSWLWLWSPLLVATLSRVMTWHLVLWLTTKWGVVMGTYLG